MEDVCCDVDQTCCDVDKTCDIDNISDGLSCDAPMAEQLRAIVVGASGRTGGAAVVELCEKGFQVVAIGNSREPLFDSPNVETTRASLEELANERSEIFQGVEAVLLHIGTQKAKSGVEGQIRLELHETIAVAEAALAAGVRTFSLVTSQGADTNSWFRHSSR